MTEEIEDKLSGGQLANRMYVIKEKLAVLSAKAEVLKTEYSMYEKQAIEHCRSEQIDQFRGTKGTVSFKETEQPHVKDWSKVYKYIHDNRAYHLLQKRISPAVWREEVAGRPRNRAIPGIGTYEVATIGLTAKRV
jgi:hypothetical protein